MENSTNIKMSAAGRLLRVNPKTIQRWIAEGKLRAFGKPPRIPLADVLAMTGDLPPDYVAWAIKWRRTNGSG